MNRGEKKKIAGNMAAWHDARCIVPAPERFPGVWSAFKSPAGMQQPAADRLVFWNWILRNRR